MKKFLKFIFVFLKIALAILIFIVLILLIISLIQGKSLTEMYHEFLDLKYFALGYLLIGILALLGFMFNGFVEQALQYKKGKLYQMFEVIYGICIVFLYMVGIALVGQGLVSLYNESRQWFVAFIASSAFVIYYYFKKKGS